eukprot:TRINITY_DN67917_c3_g1_i1.p1 TRINITY_DN67917_c3_g1~~TRINITY_DN67917_c3_g1_i1.p1  ORF type:complete len:396 (-),score=20.57 TRINITY_DN67917_c3_g1_i1:603-1790(-)
MRERNLLASPILTLTCFGLLLVFFLLWLGCQNAHRHSSSLEKAECSSNEWVAKAFANESLELLQERRKAKTLPPYADLFAKKAIELLQRLQEAKDRAAHAPPMEDVGGDPDEEILRFSHLKPEGELADFLGSHFDLSQFGEAFFTHAYENKKRIQSSWHKWKSYDTLDISNCQTEVPECRFYTQPAINNSAYSADRIYRKCCVEHMRLKKTLVWTMDVLHAHNLSAWLAMGSLLAQVRHNGIFVPWDTDIDMYLWGDGDAEARLLQAFPNLKPRVHWFGRDPKGRAVYWIYHTPYRSPGSSHIEIWFWKTGRTKDPHIYDELVYPLKECQLYNVKCWCPKNSEEMLATWYGDDWRTYHITGGTSTKMLTDAYNPEVVKKLLARGIPESRIYHTVD